MKYCHVVNNKISYGPVLLSNKWVDDNGGTHDLTLLSASELLALGWYVVIDAPPVDFLTEEISSVSFSIVGTEVHENIGIEILLLEDVIERKVDVINAYSTELLVGTLVWNTHTILGDSAARQNITGLAAAIANGVPLPANFTWDDSLGVPFVMTATDVVSMGATMMSWTDTIIKNTQNHIATVNGLLTIADVIAYDFMVGWP